MKGRLSVIDKGRHGRCGGPQKEGRDTSEEGAKGESNSPRIVSEWVAVASLREGRAEVVIATNCVWPDH